MAVFQEDFLSNELLKVFIVCHSHIQDAVPVLYLREGRTIASAFLVWYLLLTSFIYIVQHLNRLQLPLWCLYS